MTSPDLCGNLNQLLKSNLRRYPNILMVLIILFWCVSQQTPEENFLNHSDDCFLIFLWRRGSGWENRVPAVQSNPSSFEFMSVTGAPRCSVNGAGMARTHISSEGHLSFPNFFLKNNLQLSEPCHRRKRSLFLPVPHRRLHLLLLQNVCVYSIFQVRTDSLAVAHNDFGAQFCYNTQQISMASSVRA